MCFLAQENYINLPGLLFSCKYKVTVHMLKSKRRSKDESTTFLTPSCATIRSKTHKHIPCPGEGGEYPAASRIKSILKSVLILSSGISDFPRSCYGASEGVGQA